MLLTTRQLSQRLAQLQAIYSSTGRELQIRQVSVNIWQVFKNEKKKKRRKV